MAINWGELSFSRIEPLASWDAPSHGGIYAITFRPDHQNQPDRHQVVYFGEADKFDERGIGTSHHKYDCWKKHANGNQLYISTHRDDIDTSRESKEKQLISSIKPVCNDQFT